MILEKWAVVITVGCWRGKPTCFMSKGHPFAGVFLLFYGCPCRDFSSPDRRGEVGWGGGFFGMHSFSLCLTSFITDSALSLPSPSDGGEMRTMYSRLCLQEAMIKGHIWCQKWFFSFMSSSVHIGGDTLLILSLAIFKKSLAGCRFLTAILRGLWHPLGHFADGWWRCSVEKQFEILA